MKCQKKPVDGVSNTTLALRKSLRTHRPIQRFSHSLYYLLLIDKGEPEYYDEALEVDERTK